MRVELLVIFLLLDNLAVEGLALGCSSPSFSVLLTSLLYVLTALLGLSDLPDLALPLAVSLAAWK